MTELLGWILFGLALWGAGSVLLAFLLAMLFVPSDPEARR